MPKYTLKRDQTQQDRQNKKGKQIENDYQKQKTSGEQKLQQDLGGSEGFGGVGGLGGGAQEQREDGGIEPIYQSGILDFVFEGIELKDQKFLESFDLVIHEKMDQLYRYGEMTIYDNNGFVEFSSITNTWDDEHLEITLRNRYEGDNGRTFKFGLYGLEQTPLDYVGLEPRNKKIKYKLYEEPFYTNYHREIYGDSYNDNTANQIIASVLAKRVKAENIKMVEGEKDPKIISFVNPNWSTKKLIKYMQFYGDKGPIKVFNVSKGDDTITIVSTLGKLISGEVYPHEMDMVPSISEKVQGAFKLGPYKIYGPNEMHNINSLSGETIITFDYFQGKDTPKDLDDFPEKDKEKYKFDEGNEEFALNKRTPASILSGKFKEALKKAEHLGKKLLYKKDKKSNQKHGYFIDVEEKSLVEAKMFNRFNEAYLKSGMMLYTILPGNKEINIGQIWNIEIPSNQQDKKISSNGEKDETLSGKWILWNIDHKVRSSAGEGRVVYELHCYFLKTGLDISNRKNADDAQS